MTTGRMEAFSDGVIAILITIMVLDLKVPQEGVSWESLRPLLPTLVTYVLSYFYLGIYWNNHHHMLQSTERVNGRILWANLHLLFWLSLIPFATGWMGVSHFSPLPTALYGIILLCAAIGYWILQAAIIGDQGPASKLRDAVGMDVKGKGSIAAYLLSVAIAFYYPMAAVLIFALVAAIWIIPDSFEPLYATRYHPTTYDASRYSTTTCE